MITNTIYEGYLRRTRHNLSTSDELIHDPIKVRSVFLSDLHLGSEGCKAQELVHILNHFDTERLYLVGDILDAWKYKIFNLNQIGRLFTTKNAALKLPPPHAHVIQKILRHARRDHTIVYWIPGNHDNFLRFHLPNFQTYSAHELQTYLEFISAASEIGQPSLRNKEIADDLDRVPYTGDIHPFLEIIHETADGRRLLVRHGDEFDALMRHQWLGVLGTSARDQLYRTSEWLSRNDEYWAIRLISRRLLGLSEDFSLADYVNQYKNKRDLNLPEIAKGFISYKNQLLQNQRRTEHSRDDNFYLDGIIFGHSHIPSLTNDGIISGNCGDWLNPEHCTAIMEHFDGKLELVCWKNKEGIVPYKEGLLYPAIPPRPTIMTSTAPFPVHVPA